jgi:two-component system, OmpR family, sensor histidine kinase CiaH
MQTNNKKKLTTVTIVYWVMLLYIVAALVWWFISLSNQNLAMANLRMAKLDASDPAYHQKLLIIQDAKSRKTAQYVGEGFIFLILILVGAVFIYRATKKQLTLAQHQQNFMMAITHELKTPIAITTLNLETLQKRKLDDVQQQRLIGNTLDETTRLNDLCNNILITSQLESGTSRIVKEELELGALAQDCVQQYQRRFANRQFSFETTADTAILGDQLLLQIMINNLIENAIKYTPKNTTIGIEVKLAGTKVQLAIKDNGIGIADSEKKQVFEKFYRIGDERTRTSKGTGLGLYLCKKIMNDHKGDLTVTDNEPIGSIFTASFKKV